MFERGKDIRAAKIAEIRAKEWRKGYEEGYAKGRAKVLARFQVLLKSRGITLSPEDAEAIFGDGGKRGFWARRFRRRASGF